MANQRFLSKIRILAIQCPCRKKYEWVYGDTGDLQATCDACGADFYATITEDMYGPEEKLMAVAHICKVIESPEDNKNVIIKGRKVTAKAQKTLKLRNHEPGPNQKLVLECKKAMKKMNAADERQLIRSAFFDGEGYQPVDLRNLKNFRKNSNINT